MSSLRAWCLRVTNLFGKERRDRELAEELESHLHMHIEENCRSGMSPEEARRRALIKLGGIEQTKERYRSQRSVPIVESLLQDIRFGVRMLRKSPGFTIVAVLTLALGIGANTAIFSVIDRVLFNLFPFTQPEKLVAIYQSDPGISKANISYPNFLDLQRENHTFQAMTLWRNSGFILTSGGDAEQLQGKMVSANYFSVLGITPIRGRTFLPEEDQLGASPVALIGEALWKGRFAADPNVVGATLRLDGKLYSVVGVVPLFRVFGGGDKFQDDVYVPLGQWEEKGFRNRDSGLGTVGYGRLEAGVTLAQAHADVDRIASNLAAAYPSANKGIGIPIVPLKEDTVGEVRSTLWMLFAAVGFVLLIACTNIANLLLALSTMRTREFAIRAAVGASRVRMMRQLLTEGILLSIAGGAFATIMVAWGTRAVLKALPLSLPGASLVTLNARVLFFASGISILTGVLFGLVPAFKTSRSNLQETLKKSGRAVSGERHRAQGVLIVTEIALVLVLLVGAGLMIRSLARLSTVDPGFDRHGVLAFGLVLPPTNALDPAKTRARLRELNGRIASLPGVESASLNLASLPFLDNWTTVSWPASKPKPISLGDRYPTFFYAVAPDYFKVMRIPLLRGRLFNRQDDDTAPTVTVVDEDLARSLFGSQDPVGKQVIYGHDEVAEIVGVVGHVKMGGLDKEGQIQIPSQLYVPYLQLSSEELSIGAGDNLGAVVRSSIPSSVLLTSIQKAVSGLDSNYVIHDARTMDDLVQRSLAQRRFSMFLLSAFAGIALVLAILGIYGVISYVVSGQTHEFGLRMAFGAPRSSILKMVLGRGLSLALIGVAIGVVGALALTRFLSSLLFGVRPTDPLTYSGVVVLLVGVALLACYLPARRATRVDPIVALRYE